MLLEGSQTVKVIEVQYGQISSEKKDTMPTTDWNQRSETFSLLISWLTFILVAYCISFLLLNKMDTPLY